MASTRIPQPVERAMLKLWPELVIEPFDRDESYLHEIRDRLERDLGKISGAAIRWRSGDGEPSWGDEDDWDEDDFDDEPPSSEEWRSYHAYFLAPAGEDFEFECESEPLDADEEPSPGRGWWGLVIGVCLGAPVAMVAVASFEEFENGQCNEPQLDPVYLDLETDGQADQVEVHRRMLGEARFGEIEKLRAKAVKVLERHGLLVIDERTARLETAILDHSPEVFVNPPLRVLDAFFFRSV